MKIRMPENQDLPLTAVLFASFLCVLFGGNVVAIKVSLTGLGPFTAAGMRFSLAALALFIWAAVTRRPLKIPLSHAHRLLALCVVFFIQLSMFYIGISKTNATHAAILLNMQPFFIMFLAHFFIPGDRITWRKILGLLLGFTGVALVFLERTGVETNFLMGDAIILIASFLWACNGVYTKKILPAFAPFQLVLYPMFFSSIFMLAAGAVWDKTMIFRLDVPVISSMVYQSLVSAAFGFVAWNTMLKKYGAVAMHSFIFIMPISGVLLGGLILEEPITPRLLSALVLIVMGILVIHYKQKRRPPPLPAG
ncbi:MAG: DMT family transporter [Desulfobacterales bacterium]|nr:DMT family transporter [Desulfobacterales bacterium]